MRAKIITKQPEALTTRAAHNHFIVAVGILLLSLFVPVVSKAMEEPDYDEVIVLLNVQRVGGLEVTAVIKGQELFLPMADVFNFLKIKNSLSAGLDSVTGFFINPQATFVIDRSQSRISFGEHVFDLKPDDLIRTESNLYLRSDYFGKVFGLECRFIFRSLSVIMDTKLDLPVIREMRQEMMRRNIRQLKGEIKADTIIRRAYPLFHLGMADWSIVNTQQLPGHTDTRLNLTVGSVIAGGEATVSMNYQNNALFSAKRQYYLWRFVNNNHPALRQVILGKIAPQATSSILAPVVGMQFTNTPTTYRRSFGTYTVSNFTEPGWTVELYVNNVMVDYTKADASGFFKFEIPLIYGNSSVLLRFYGPWGEERSSEKNINIPFNFLPRHEFEYTISAGMPEDGSNTRFYRAGVNYGLSRRITIGGGTEYLSSVTSGKNMPFLNAALRLASNLLVYGEYAHGVRSKSVMSYRLRSDIQLEMNYTRYAKGQKAINTGVFEERKVTFSLPLRAPSFALFSRLTLSQTIAPKSDYSIHTKYSAIPKTKYTTTELMFSGTFHKVSTNFTTYGIVTDQPHSSIYSNLSLGFRLPAGILFTPQAQFEYIQKQLMTMKFGVEKRLLRNNFLSISYENSFQTKSSNVMVGLRYDFSFARTMFSATRSNKTATLVQSARGSFIYDAKTKYDNANNRTSIGRGGIVLLPYLDLNCNGRREANEPKVSGLNFHIDGGRIVPDSRDTIIRILDLEPYRNYYIELNGNSFDNIAWQIKKKVLSVAVDPNQLKLVEVPVSVVGEVSGTVFMPSDKGRKGLGRIIVSFYNSDSRSAGQTLTEPDGSFSYLGLSPGSYTARLDSIQLGKLHLSSSPAEIPFNILINKDGEVVDGLEFMLHCQ